MNFLTRSLIEVIDKKLKIEALSWTKLKSQDHSKKVYALKFKDKNNKLCQHLDTIRVDSCITTNEGIFYYSTASNNRSALNINENKILSEDYGKYIIVFDRITIRKLQTLLKERSKLIKK